MTSFEYHIDRPKYPRKKNPLLVYLHGYGENFNRLSVKTKSSLPGCIEDFPILQNFTIVTPFSPRGILVECGRFDSIYSAYNCN